MAAVAALALGQAGLSGCGGPATLPVAPDTMTLASATFGADMTMPDWCGADKGNVSPELHWGGIPAGAKSYVVVLQDPDAPSATPFVHWLVYNIPSTVRAIEAGKTPPGALVGKNDAGTDAYFGPKPPSGTHHYRFRVYALDRVLGIGPGASVTDVAAAMQGHTLAIGELVGLFSRG